MLQCFTTYRTLWYWKWCFFDEGTSYEVNVNIHTFDLITVTDFTVIDVAVKIVCRHSHMCVCVCAFQSHLNKYLSPSFSIALCFIGKRSSSSFMSRLKTIKMCLRRVMQQENWFYFSIACVIVLSCHTIACRWSNFTLIFNKFILNAYFF